MMQTTLETIAPAAPKPEPAADNGKPRMRKNRKTCYDCNKASSMVIEGVGYCEEHGKERLVPE